MIEELRISGIGVIDEARVELDPGFTVITGETGAGKTMVLSGLDLLRGARADAGMLRDSSGSAEVDAVVGFDDQLSHGGRAAIGEQFAELGLDWPEDDALITRRTVSGGGRSRAYLGGRPAPVSALSAVWSHVVAVHGQMDQARLRESAWQRGMVDRFGGAPLAQVRDEYTWIWRQWQETRRELELLLAGAQEAERTANLLRLGIAEIDEVDPQPGEDDALDAEAAVLSHAGSLRDAAQTAREHLVGSGEDIDAAAALTAIAKAKDALAGIAHVDERLAELATRIGSLVNEVGDVESELGDYLRGLDADPARQAWVEERRSRLTGLRKSYGATIEDVLRWRADSAQQIAAADHSEERIAELTVLEAELAGQAQAAAAVLSQQRCEAAGTLAQAVQIELAALAMPEAQVEIGVESSTDRASLAEHGGDVVQMSLIPHAGASARPLGKGASGGELSRLALAFEVALAGGAPVPTMVFDEVDAGVGGAVAVEVGRRLARLSKHVQVLVVTHLPQVAAFADRHLVVTKGSDGSVTSANVVAVDGPDRVAELVRMLSGLEGSATGAAHAQELLDVARQEAGV